MSPSGVVKCILAIKMSVEDTFSRWMRLTADSANLKIVVAVWSFVLVMGTLVVTNSRSSNELFGAVMVVSYQIFCSYLSNFRFKLACYLLAVPLLPLAVLHAVALVLSALDGREVSPISVLWFMTAAFVGLYSSIAVSAYERTGGGN